MAKNKNNGNVTVVKTKSRRAADIVVFVVVGLAALILIAVAVLSAVRINPTDKFEKPEEYKFYVPGSSGVSSTNSEAQAKLDIAVNEMDFSIMTAILQAHWDYKYHFNRNADEDKTKNEISGVEVIAKSPSDSQYMVEFVYKDIQYSDIRIENGVISYANAQSLNVDGETVYFDRLKVLIGNTDGNVGTIELYPYISGRTLNTSDDVNWASALYNVTGITVRADTTKAYAALAELATDLARG